MLKLELELKNEIAKAIEKMGLVDVANFELSVTKDERYGDLTTNIAMIVASKLKKKPHDVAKELLEKLGNVENIEKMEIAGPGFINFRIDKKWFRNYLNEISTKGSLYGSTDYGKGKKVQVEFVSANPTGPLHIGHGRGAVYGDTIANLLSLAGFEVIREYYINDAGVQMQTLGLSVYTRMRQILGEKVEFPENCYQGEYITDIANEMMGFNPDIKNLQSDVAVKECTKFASAKILDEIKDDLKKTGIVHDVYFSENTLHEKGEVEMAIKLLREKGYLFEQDNALWFRTTDFGDDKDRVLIKSDGQYTYLTADIAYHLDKFRRGFDWVIDIWGADHGGYVKRMEASIQAFGYKKEAFNAILIQLVNLVRNGQKVSMSTRRATYETLQDVREKVGKDVCRYFFLMRSHNAPLDFDLALAEKQTPENPVFYIQYAHARIASVFRKANEQGISAMNNNLELLSLPEEISLMRNIALFPKVVLESAINLEPHRVAYYLLELTGQFQSYYSRAKTDDRYKFLTEDALASSSKLYLLKNIKQVIQNGLNALGISAPDEMSNKGEDDERI